MAVKDVDQAHQVFQAEGGDRQVVGLELGDVDQQGAGGHGQAADVQAGEDQRLRHRHLDAGVGGRAVQAHARLLREAVVAGAAPVAGVVVVGVARVFDDGDAAGGCALRLRIVDHALDEAGMDIDAEVGVGEVFAGGDVGLDQQLRAFEVELHGLQRLESDPAKIVPGDFIGHGRLVDEDGIGIEEKRMEFHGRLGFIVPLNS